MLPRNPPEVSAAAVKDGAERAAWRTVPNLLTLLRLALVVPFAWFAILGRDMEALGVFALAGLTDAFDGYIARRFGQRSKFGRLADPVADKILTSTAFVVLSAFRGQFVSLPLWLMAAVVLRDVLILIGCFVVYLVTRSTAFRPTISGKINTILEIFAIVCFLASASLPAISQALGPLYLVLLVSIVISAADYVLLGFRMIRNSPRV